MKEELSEDTDLRRKALQMAGIGILLFGMVCSGCDRKAQVNAEPESSEKIEYAVTETEEVSTETKKLVIEDLDDAYEALLDSCSKEFIGDYRIDESFLNWVYANYGKEAVLNRICSDGNRRSSIKYCTGVPGRTGCKYLV